jgi:hypothetical protein
LGPENFSQLGVAFAANGIAAARAVANNAGMTLKDRVLFISMTP